MENTIKVRYTAVDGGDEVTIYAHGPDGSGSREVNYGPVLTLNTPDGNGANFERLKTDLALILDAVRNMQSDGGPNSPKTYAAYDRNGRKVRVTIPGRE